MKTPMQELFDYVQNDWDGDGETLLYQKAELLKKEEEMIKDAWTDGAYDYDCGDSYPDNDDSVPQSGEEYYNKKFKQ